MAKQPTSFRLPDITVNQIAALTQQTGLTQSEVVQTAIDRMYREEMKPMNTETQTAQAIYTEVYGHIDDKHFKAEKLAEIEEWLTEGDPSDNMTELVAEWREYDAA